MPKYHFTAASENEVTIELPQTRLSIDLSNRPDPTMRSEYYASGDPLMRVDIARGSYILVDLASQYTLNKLHIGSTIRRHHLEQEGSLEERGSRVDLADVDISYAHIAVHQLKHWRNPNHRQMLKEEYKEVNGYWVTYRLRQLEISPQGLEKKIRGLQREVIGRLKHHPESKFVSEKVTELDSTFNEFFQLMKSTLPIGPAESRGGPKIVQDTSVVELAQDMYGLLRSIIEYVHPRINMNEVKNYWNRVWQWGDQ